MFGYKPWESEGLELVLRPDLSSPEKQSKKEVLIPVWQRLDAGGNLWRVMKSSPSCFSSEHSEHSEHSELVNGRLIKIATFPMQGL